MPRSILNPRGHFDPIYFILPPAELPPLNLNLKHLRPHSQNISIHGHRLADELFVISKRPMATLQVTNNNLAFLLWSREAAQEYSLGFQPQV